MEVTNAVWINIDEANENTDGKWIPIGFVYCENVVDSSDRTELEMAINEHTIEIVEQLENGEFTHIVKDPLGNLFAVTVAGATQDEQEEEAREHARKHGRWIDVWEADNVE